MAKITTVETLQVDLKPKVKRTDAVQSFEFSGNPDRQNPRCGTASKASLPIRSAPAAPRSWELLDDHLVPLLIGREADEIERIWRDLFYRVHATTVGALTSIALAAIDTALWDLRSKRAKLPLHKAAGGAKDRIKLYYTEGGWLHIDEGELVEEALKARERGFGGTKIKVGRPHVAEDVRRLRAVRKAVGDDFDVMTDANQGFMVDEAIRRARHYEECDIAWFEEPIHADDVMAHKRLCESTANSDCRRRTHVLLVSIQGLPSEQCLLDRPGRCRPHRRHHPLAEGRSHGGSLQHSGLPSLPDGNPCALCCAVPNSRWLEFIPQLIS